MAAVTMDNITVKTNMSRLVQQVLICDALIALVEWFKGDRSSTRTTPVCSRA